MYEWQRLTARVDRIMFDRDDRVDRVMFDRDDRVDRVVSIDRWYFGLLADLLKTQF